MAATRALKFGELLRQLRIAAGLTQEALAERTGLGCAAFSIWKAARISPTVRRSTA